MEIFQWKYKNTTGNYFIFRIQVYFVITVVSMEDEKKTILICCDVRIFRLSMYSVHDCVDLPYNYADLSDTFFSIYLGILP